LYSNALLFRDAKQQKQSLPVTLAVWDGGCQSLEEHKQWICGQCHLGRAVMVLEPSGCGTITPHPVNGREPREHYGVIHKFADDLAWLDDDLAALRTYDVLRALDMLAIWPGIDSSNIQGYAAGKHGMYLRLAVMLDSRLKTVEVSGGLSSYHELASSRHYDSHDIKSIVIRGVLRHTDA
jgi:hypothetical protein